MPPTTAIFLDDGGVMNDNSLRSAQWERLVGEYLAPRLGGALQDWAEANKAVVAREGELRNRLWGRPGADYGTIRDVLDTAWLLGMTELVGVDAPEGEDCLALARETYAFVTRRVHSAYPGAVDAIRELHSVGCRLYTASGEDSDDLEGYLEAMGVRNLFGAFYGPDLVDVRKMTPEFYRRVFEDAGVTPGEALVVDDSPAAVGWANAAGAKTVLVSPDETHFASPVVKSLAEVPALISAVDTD